MRPFGSRIKGRCNGEGEASETEGRSFSFRFWKNRNEKDRPSVSLQSGTVLGMFDQGWNIGAAQQYLTSQRKYENTWLAIPLVYDPEYVDGQIIQEHYLNGSDMNKDRGFGISVSCEDPARMVQLFDTLLSDEWQTILQWGIEGVDYTVDENGRMVMTQEQYSHLSSEEWRLANKADVLLNSIPKKQGTMDNGNSWDPSNQPEVYYANMSEYDKEFLAACGKTTPGEFFNSPIELAPYGEAWQLDISEIGDTYNDFLMIQQEDLPGIITCSPEELDNKWDAFVERVSVSADTVTEHLQGEITKIVGSDVSPEKCGNNLTWTLAEGQLTVSGHGNMFNYEDWEDAPWYARRSEIQKVVIGDGVTGIGEFTFYGCSQLAQVTMTDSVQRIGRRAFGHCGSLADLQLSSSLVEIDIGAFEECGALKSVTLTGSLKRIGYAAFAACGLTNIQIPAGTPTRVWDRVFDMEDSNTIYLHHITLPASVAMVEYGAFWGNPLPHDTPDVVTPADLTVIEAEAFNGIDARFVWLSDRVESIGDSAFANCPNLQYVYIPYGCDSIGTNAFPEGTILLGINGYSSNCYANDYADENGLTFISYENPFGGEG